ncbi:hypothetical protein D3C76_763090 [compost metagenome]
MGEGHQVLLVLLRHEAGRRAGKAKVGQADQAAVDQQGDGAATQDAGDGADVAVAGAVEEAVERTEQPAAEQLVEQHGEAVLRFVMTFQQHGGQCRRQGQRVDRGDHRGNGDGQRELPVELPGKAGDEGGRDEYGAQHQRGGDDRTGHFLHGALGRLYRRQPKADIPFDVLHHHDGVVHHDADGQHQAEQR